MHPSFPHATVALPDGRRVDLPAGALIGRLSTADLRVDDEDVSEAHALVSLRRGTLRLLGLRGGFEVAGQRKADVTLEAGLVVHLSASCRLTVVEVNLPARVHVLEGLCAAPVEIPRPVVSLLTTPVPRLAPGVEPGAAAVVRHDGAGLWIQVGEDPPEPMTPGAWWDLDGTSVRYGLAPLGDDRATLLHSAPPVHIELGPELVTVRAPGRRDLALVGLAAELLRVLATTPDPLHWESLCARLWRQRDQAMWRARLDALRKDLRARLREHGLRDDLVWSAAGMYRLLTYPGDRVVERA